MSNWLGRMFTVPRRVREQIAAIPGAHALGQAVQAETVAVAQHAVDAIGLPAALAEQIKTSIETHVQQAIPIPAEPANEGAVGRVIDGLVGSVVGHLVDATGAAVSPAVPPLAAEQQPDGG